jgi:hypothetical protein
MGCRGESPACIFLSERLVFFRQFKQRRPRRKPAQQTRPRERVTSNRCLLSDVLIRHGLLGLRPSLSACDYGGTTIALVCYSQERGRRADWDAAGRPSFSETIAGRRPGGAYDSDGRPSAPPETTSNDINELAVYTQHYP